MPQYMGPGAFHAIGHVMIDDLTTALEDSVGGGVQRASMVPGETAWDQCDCGLLAVSMRRQWLSDDFPEGQFAQSIVRSSPCNLPWLVGEFRVQVVRCSPSPQGNELAPTPAALDEASRVLLSDMHVMTNTVTATLCDLKETDQIIDYTIGELDTIGPDGGCVGGELIVFISIYRN